MYVLTGNASKCHNNQFDYINLAIKALIGELFKTWTFVSPPSPTNPKMT